MNIFTKIKGWLKGHGGEAAEMTLSTASPSIRLEDIDQLIASFENRMDSKYDLSKLTERALASSKDASILLDRVQNCLDDKCSINTNEVKTQSIPVESRSLEEIVNDVPLNDGSLILKDNKVIKLNDLLFKALCPNTDFREFFEKGSIDLLKLFPRKTVKCFVKYFTSRSFDQLLEIEVRPDVTALVSINEFVLDSKCYQKIQIVNLVEHV